MQSSERRIWKKDVESAMKFQNCLNQYSKLWTMSMQTCEDRPYLIAFADHPLMVPSLKP